MTNKPCGRSIPAFFANFYQTFRSLGTKIIPLLACVAVISACLININPTRAEAALSYLFDRAVTWADGTTERVQIDSDGIIRLNGIARRLLGLNFAPSGFSGDYYSSANLALLDKELSYLQSKGVRTMEVLLTYEGSYHMEAAHYKPVLDLMYKHKMIVMPLFTLKYYSSFNNLKNVNIPLSGDSLTELVGRWCAVVNSYQNVAAIYVENELDYRVNGQTYGASQAGAYMKLLTGLFRQNSNLPLATKLAGYFPGGTVDQIKQAVIPYVDIPAFDIYQYDATWIGKRVDDTKAWLAARGYSSSKWWAGEFNAVNASNGTTASRLNSTFLDAAFSRGVPVIHLWIMHRTKELAAALFDAYGNPISAMVNLAPYINGFQTAISVPSTPSDPVQNPIVTKTTPTITWNTPANITYGTPLSTTQLNATASVAGNFLYTPAAGTVLPAGNGQALRVDFSPADTSKYNATTKTVTINVTTPTVTPAVSLTITSPYSGSVLTVGSTITISWTSTGDPGYLNLILSRDGGVSWTPIKYYTPNDGKETWTVTGPATSNARIGLISQNNSNISSLTKVTIK
jgi:hypothetical protein